MLELLLGAALAAQNPESPASDVGPVERQEESDRAAQINGSPTGRALNLLDGGDFSLEINEKKSEATFSYAFDFLDRDRTADREGVRISHTTLDLGLTLPVGGADNLLDGGTFDRFSEGPTLSLSLTWFGWTSRDRFESVAFRRLMADAYRRCTSEPGTRGADYCNLNRDRPTRRFVEDYTNYSDARINRALSSSAIGFGIEGELGFDLFDYRTPVTLAENSRTEPNFSATASLFYFPADGVSLFAGTVEYENLYKARDNEILCRAVIVDPNDDCVSAPSAPPRHVERLSLGIEYRRSLGSVPGLGQFGIAPQVSYDVLGDHYRVEMPVYLTPDGNSSFRPGISFSYVSEDNEFVIGLFLRKSFSLGR